MESRKLTPKQQAFADYYIETGNATQSAIKAGYSKRTATVIGAENLIKPNIKKYIDKRMQKLADKRIMGAQEALELLTSIARAEITEEVVLSSETGISKVDKIPDIRDRQRAAEELLKRYTLGDNQKLRDEMLKAQIEKVKRETERIAKEDSDVELEEIVIVDEWNDGDE
jgi:phage terminase small subunit